MPGCMCANPVFLVFLLSIYNSVSAHPVLVKKLLHLYNYIYIYIYIYNSLSVGLSGNMHGYSMVQSCLQASHCGGWSNWN